jgi:hypothetical protein
MEKMDGKAECDQICKSDSKLVDHNNCRRYVVTVCGAETWQNVKISHQILMQAPNKGINSDNRDRNLHIRDESPSMLAWYVGRKGTRQQPSSSSWGKRGRL